MGLVVGNSISKNNKAYNAIVQVDVNPSIEMVVDEKNQVLSVRGLNDEGKMVLEGEAFIGKNVDDVVGEIIRIETELGYLVVGKMITKSQLQLVQKLIKFLKNKYANLWYNCKGM